MRKFILSLACLIGISAMALETSQEVNAVKFVQGQTTDWYSLASNPEVTFTNGNPVINGKTYDLAIGDVTTTFGIAPEGTWYTVRTNVTSDNWNTICLEHNITAIDGATFWNVVAERTNEFELEQVFAPFPAGAGYIIRYTATELKVQYGNVTADAPAEATSEHPIQGRFTEITCDAYGSNELVNNYVVYNNKLCTVKGWVSMADHRAYVVAELAPKTAPAIAHGPRMTMPKPNNTPTGLKVQDARCTMHDGKFLINGQFVIIRDNKMYNAQGIEL